MAVIIAEKHRKTGELALVGESERKRHSGDKEGPAHPEAESRRLSGPQEGSAPLDGNSWVWSRRSLARGDCVDISP